MRFATQFKKTMTASEILEIAEKILKRVEEEQEEWDRWMALFYEGIDAGKSGDIDRMERVRKEMDIITAEIKNSTRYENNR